jgi:hypothetical protein
LTRPNYVEARSDGYARAKPKVTLRTISGGVIHKEKPEVMPRTTGSVEDHAVTGAKTRNASI